MACSVSAVWVFVVQAKIFSVSFLTSDVESSSVELDREDLSLFFSSGLLSVGLVYLLMVVKPCKLVFCKFSQMLSVVVVVRELNDHSMWSPEPLASIRMDSIIER